MARIHGKQLKDASLNLHKVEGIASDVATDKLLLTAASGAAQALTLAGDLSQAISGSTLTISVDSVQDSSVVFSSLADATVITEVEGISSNDVDNALPTAAAVKDYVDSSVSTSSGSQSLSMAGDSGTDSVVLSTDTLTVAGGSNITTAVTDNNISVALDSHISLASMTLSGAAAIGGNLEVTGNLTVQGTTTTVNSTEVEVADAHLRLGAGTSTAATLITAAAGIILGEDAAGISFRLDAQGDFGSTQSIDLATGKVFKIADTEVLSADGAAKVQSAVAGDGLTHTNGVLSSNGLKIDTVEVALAITSGGTITTEPASYVGVIKLELNGITQIEGTDWSISSGNIVWLDSDIDLENGDVITMTYHLG
jgi:hypothetical protein